jgi:hypothetical protein
MLLDRRKDDAKYTELQITAPSKSKTFLKALELCDRATQYHFAYAHQLACA